MRIAGRFFLGFALAMMGEARVSAQCSVSSTNGYTVNMHVYPEAIVPGSDNCPNGYNYRVRMRYSVGFTGSNIPSSLHTLQGTVTCGSTSIFFDLPNNGGSGTVLSSNAWTSMTNCATTSPLSLGCNTVQVQIEGPSLSSRTINCSFTPLPVELVHFAAKPSEGRVELEWITASELNNDHFSVERSVDGVAFETALRMSGAGNSASPIAYAAVDENPPPGPLYYRLLQTDSDGTATSSEIVAVDNPLIARLGFVPNPASDGLVWLRGASGDGTIALHDATGLLVANVAVRDGRVVLPRLAPGSYQGRWMPEQGAAPGYARLIID